MLGIVEGGVAVSVGPVDDGLHGVQHQDVVLPEGGENWINKRFHYVLRGLQVRESSTQEWHPQYPALH